METGRGQRTQLMPPGVPQFGKAVAQQDRRSRPLLRDVHADTIGLHHVVRHISWHHRLRSIGAIRSAKPRKKSIIAPLTLGRPFLLVAVTIRCGLTHFAAAKLAFGGDAAHSMTSSARARID